jgi:hypothetical protein
MRFSAPIKIQLEVLGMFERFFEGMASVKRELEQSATSSEVPNRKKGRRDLEQASLLSGECGHQARETVIEGCGEGLIRRRQAYPRPRLPPSTPYSRAT